MSRELINKRLGIFRNKEWHGAMIRSVYDANELNYFIQFNKIAKSIGCEDTWMTLDTKNMVWSVPPNNNPEAFSWTPPTEKAKEEYENRSNFPLFEESILLYKNNNKAAQHEKYVGRFLTLFWEGKWYYCVIKECKSDPHWRYGYLIHYIREKPDGVAEEWLNLDFKKMTWDMLPIFSPLPIRWATKINKMKRKSVGKTIENNQK